jgi:hypothetical protein
MNNKLTTVNNSGIPAEVLELLGPTPTITAAEHKVYTAILQSFAQIVQPCDLIESMYVRDLADAQLEVQRYGQLAANIVRQARRDRLGAFTQQVRMDLSRTSEQERKEAQAQLEHEIIQLKGSPQEIEAGTARLKNEYKKLLDTKVSDIDHQWQRRVKELEQRLASGDEDAALLARWILPYERMVRLKAAARMQFDKAVEAIDDYRRGLGERLRMAAEVIDGEFEEAASSQVPAVQSPPLGVTAKSP